MVEEIKTNNGNSKIYYINIDKIKTNELNKVYEDKNYETLKISIEEYGLKTPLTVVKDGEDSYKLIAGHRRLACIKMLLAENKIVKFGNRELTTQVPCMFENAYVDEGNRTLVSTLAR